MNKTEAQNKITELENKIQELKAIIDKPDNKRWRADKGGVYYCIYGEGTCYSEERDDEYDNCRYSIGNYFKTEEEAELYKRKLIATQKLLDMCDITEEDWKKKDKSKFYIYYNYYNKKFETACFFIFKENNYNFSTLEKAEQAIKEMGDDLYLVFNVKKEG